MRLTDDELRLIADKDNPHILKAVATELHVWAHEVYMEGDLEFADKLIGRAMEIEVEARRILLAENN
jgi:hypothetical protein